MGDSDALLWMVESDPKLRSTITAVVLLDRTPDPDRVRAMFERGCRAIPRLRQRVRHSPMSIAPPRWEDDPDFDLDYHLRFVNAPEPGDLDSVLSIAQPVAMAAFDRERPLWEAVIVGGLADGGGAIVVKIHHAVTDGVGSMQLALVLFELERDPEPGASPADLPPAELMGRVRRWWDAMDHERRRAIEATRHTAPNVASGLLSTIRGLAADPMATTRGLFDTLRSVHRMAAPTPNPLSPLMRERSLSVRFSTFRIPMEEARAVARRNGVTLNTVFLAAATGGMARYHEAMEEPAVSLRFTVPIDMRSEDEEEIAGNHVMLARLILPLDIADPVERMTTIDGLVKELRDEPALGLNEPLAGIARRLPRTIGTGMFAGLLKGSDLITTNVPGAPIPLYSAGGRVERLIAFAPLLGSAVNLSLISYLDDLNIGVNMDPAAVTDTDLLLESLRAGWDEVLTS